MKQKFSVLPIITLSCVILFSCKKNRTDDGPPPPKKVYVLSDEETSGSGGYAGKYRIDGVVNAFINGIAEEARTIDMAVDGNNVYVLTLKKNNTTGQTEYAVYKNGLSIQTFPDNEGEFTPACIAAKGNDVYVVGTDINATFNGASLLYWKNGSMVTVTNGTNYAYGSNILINGNDIYISGYQATQGQNKIATYWRNGVATQLPDLTGSVNTSVLDLVVAGSDVYASGKSSSRACYWKNSTVFELSTPQNSGEGTGIAVSGTDVYVCGMLRNSAGYQAVYWKNGAAPVLLTPDVVDAEANDIAVDGSDIYVAGYNSETGSIYKASYWKNGVETVLTATGMNGDAKRIIVQ